MTHRLPLECTWQSGGRVSEVLRLRPCDLVEAEGALSLVNLKQKDPRKVPRKLVYVSPDLLAQLRVLARDARIPWNGYFFRSARSGDQPMSRQQTWRLIQRSAAAAGVLLPTEDGRLVPAHGRAFRHGAAVHQVRAACPCLMSSSSLATRGSTRRRSTPASRVRSGARWPIASSGERALPRLR